MRFPLLAAALALASPAQAQDRNPLDALRLDDLAATRERPLFHASRRPPEAAPLAAPLPVLAVPEAPVAVAEPPPFELIGVAIGEGAAIALVRNKATGAVLRLRPGEEAEGWRVAAMDRRELKLARDGREELLALSASAATQAAGEPAQSPSPEALAAAAGARMPRVQRPD